MAKTINHKSDFSLVWEFRGRDGNVLPVPTGDFYLHFYASYYGRKIPTATSVPGKVIKIINYATTATGARVL